MSTAEPRQLLSRGERQASILRGAAEAFARGGYAGTSMEDVAAASGITKLIVYRHFESKEKVYRAVLEQVSGRMGEELLRALNTRDRRGFAVRAVLTVARELPDGFRLLWVHAAREPQFEEYAAEYHRKATEVALSLIGETISDDTFRQWAGEAIVALLFAGVLSWLDIGDEERDEEFIEVATRGLRAMYLAWAK